MGINELKRIAIHPCVTWGVDAVDAVAAVAAVAPVDVDQPSYKPPDDLQVLLVKHDSFFYLVNIFNPLNK